MKYLFIHFRHLEEVHETFSNYIRHCEKFNDDNVDIKKHNQFIREMNRKIKKKTAILFNIYGWFEFSKYKLGDQLFKGYLVWLEMYKKELYDHIVYDNPFDIVKLLEDRQEYWNEIIEYKHSIISQMTKRTNLISGFKTEDLLKKMTDIDNMISPIKERFKGLS
tara:strand:- start:1195 stop:1686 length:492 start_codon:yes stop_codon:yes gene_type:complete